MSYTNLWKGARFFTDVVPSTITTASGTGGTITVPATAEAEAKVGKTYTDAEVDAIINKKFASWQAKQDKAIADAVAKVEEAQKLAQMTEKERQAHERKQLEEELNALKAEKAHASMVATARKMLSDDKLNIPDEIIDGLIREDADKTAKAVKAFSAVFQTAVQNAVKDQLKGGEPRRGTPSTMSKEEILNIKSTSERLKAIEEHPELFGDYFKTKKG